MERNSLIAAFSVPGLVVLYAILQRLFGPPLDGWGGIILGIQIAIGLLAAIVVGIALFALRKRELMWWHWLLISFASVPVALGIIVLVTRIESWGANPPVYDIPTGPGTKGG